MGRKNPRGGRKRKLNDKSNGTQAGSNAIGIVCDGTISSDTLEQNLHNDAGSNTAGICAQDIIVRQETNQLHNQGGPPTLAQYDPPPTERPGSSISSRTRASQRRSTADNLIAFGETPPGTLVGTISTRHIVKEDQVNRATNTGNGRVVNNVAEIMTVGGNQINEFRSSGHPKDPIESTVAGSSKMDNRKRNANNISNTGLRSEGPIKAKTIKIKVKNNNTYNSPSSSGTSQVARKPPFKFYTNPTKHFKGRADTLKAVRDFFGKVPVNTKSVSDLAVVIAGYGGMGKTETAYKVAEELEATYPCVAWINAETKESTLGSFLAFAKNLGIVKQDEKNADMELVKKIYRHIDQEYYGKVLFIFDNAMRLHSEGDDFGIYDYLPTERLVNRRYPYILITTNTSTLNWGNQIKILQVEELNFEDSMAFFRSAFRVSPAECDEELKSLHKITVGYPLAMNLVASNIDHSRHKKTVLELQQKINLYIQKFEKKKRKILTEEMNQWDTKYKKTLLAAWQMTFERLQQVPNGLEALQLLQIMSFLNLPISSQVIKEIWCMNRTDFEYMKLKELLYLLERFYIARILQVYQDDGDHFRCSVGIHRLVQLAVREQKNCCQAIEFILGFQTLTCAESDLEEEVNTSALEAALKPEELNWRTLPCVEILALYGNEVALNIVETRTPKETDGAETIWRLCNMEMTSLDKYAIKILRKLADLTNTAELRMHKLVYLQFTLNLLNEPNEFYEREDGTKFEGEFLRQSLQDILQLLDELGWENKKYEYSGLMQLDAMEDRISAVLMKLIKAFVRIDVPLPEIVCKRIAKMTILIDLWDVFWDDVIATFYSPYSSPSRLDELRTEFWDSWDVKGKMIKTFEEIWLLDSLSYSTGILTWMDFLLDGMDLMDKRVQELISAFTEMTTRVDVDTSDALCDFVINVCPVWIKLLMMDSSNEYSSKEYILKCLSRCGAVALVEGSVEEELFRPAPSIMKECSELFFELPSFPISEKYASEYYPQFIDTFSSWEDSKVKALVTFCKKMIELVGSDEVSSCDSSENDEFSSGDSSENDER